MINTKALGRSMARGTPQGLFFIEMGSNPVIGQKMNTT